MESDSKLSEKKLAGVISDEQIPLGILSKGDYRGVYKYLSKQKEFGKRRYVRQDKGLQAFIFERLNEKFFDKEKTRKMSSYCSVCHDIFNIEKYLIVHKHYIKDQYLYSLNEVSIAWKDSTWRFFLNMSYRQPDCYVYENQIKVPLPSINYYKPNPEFDMESTLDKAFAEPELTETQKEIKEVEAQLAEKKKIKTDELLLRNTSNLCSNMSMK